MKENYWWFDKTSSFTEKIEPFCVNFWFYHYTDYEGAVVVV